MRLRPLKPPIEIVHSVSVGSLPALWRGFRRKRAVPRPARCSLGRWSAWATSTTRATSPSSPRIARWEEQGRPGALEPGAIAAFLDCSAAQVIQSIGRLFRGRFVDCVDISTYGGENYIITGLTGEGLRESGLWPKPTDLSAALTEVLRREIEATAASDPGAQPQAAGHSRLRERVRFEFPREARRRDPKEPRAPMTRP